MTVAIVIVIALIGILACIARKSASSSKCKERITNAHKKIFYDAIIRYLLVNSLKLNMTLILTMKESETEERWISIALLVIFLLVPFALCYVLQKKKDKLDEEETKQRFGNLIVAFRHNDDKQKKNTQLY